MAKLKHFVALNSAIEVDLTGQVNAETAGGIYIGAVGGAIDFLRGAHHSDGGLPVIALPSTAGRGDRLCSRIVKSLNGPVSTSRADAGVIVTEYGVADLRNLSVQERIRAMIAIAAPEFREALERTSHKFEI